MVNLVLQLLKKIGGINLNKNKKEIKTIKL